jgi:hypothetical protein
MARPEKVADFFDKGMPKKKGRPKRAAQTADKPLAQAGGF